MSSLDSLAPDQRAVLQLVLARGRSYDEIAQLLSIDRAAVRARALAAMDALGPQTGLDEERRALITDYLLGQLPTAVAAQAREQLATSPPEQAWARVVSSELTPLASDPLPEVPAAVAQTAEPGRAAQPIAAPPATSEPTLAPAQKPPSSRVGGMILLGLVAVAAIVAAVVLLLASGASPNHPKAPVNNSVSGGVSSTTTTGSSSSAAHIVASISLAASQAHSKAAGIAEVLVEGANKGIAIVADHIAPNTTKPPNAYAVWLYNSAADAQLLGFVNPGVGRNGRLSTAGGLPTNAAHFRQLIVTLETKADPKTPGTIILHGALSGLS